jgi:hypothetical protein
VDTVERMAERMKVVVQLSIDPRTRRPTRYMRATNGDLFSLLVDATIFDEIRGTVDVREGDELTLDVSLVRRSRPERQA